MNANTIKILNHIVENCLTDENRTIHGDLDFNFIEADVHLDVSEGKLDAELIDRDIDEALDAVANGMTDTCMRCSRVLTPDICAEEFLSTGICADCWTEDDND